MPAIYHITCMHVGTSFFLRWGCRDQTQKKKLPVNYSDFKQPVDWSQKLIYAQTLLMKDFALPRGTSDSCTERLKNAWAEPIGDGAFRNWDWWGEYDEETPIPLQLRFAVYVLTEVTMMLTGPKGLQWFLYVLYMVCTLVCGRDWRELTYINSVTHFTLSINMQLAKLSTRESMIDQFRSAFEKQGWRKE